MNQKQEHDEGKRLWNLLSLPFRKKPAVGVTPADVIHQENKWRLLRYRPRAAGVAFSTPVLLVPSLINRHYVLDLMPGKSFAEYMVQQGHDVFLLDWGTPRNEDRFLTFDDICERYLGRALSLTASFSKRNQAHLLGYCMGGILTAIHTAVHPNNVASLVQLAAPVRFHDDGLLSAWMRTPSFDIDAMIDAFGNVPWQLMQSAFHLLRPTLPLSKAVGLVDRAWNDEFLDGFFALETWGNDNVSLPGEFYRRYARMYRDDDLVRGAMTLGGAPVHLSSIRCPLLVVTFEHDNIVPWQSAAELMTLVSSEDKQHLHLPGGHVGAVVSKSAARGLWPNISSFWALRDRTSLA
ncbi:MAG: alpha/beta fold hydrolase [Myxococcales bacterium]|nr:alpha/beta fold hydrolase [Polyangiaceae bacterium]MDW8248847.1 alpha/beta fold hydrolase [Myxococcales bacterium]